MLCRSDPVVTHTCIYLGTWHKSRTIPFRSMVRLVVVVAFLVGTAAGCHTQKTPELRVLGVHDAPASHVFVQVTNPARRPMRLTKLQYVFASAQNGAKVSEGELALSREIPAGAAVVVEVPLEAEES